MRRSGKREDVDYYALLNVARHASREEIKAAFTKLARTLHPDKRSGALSPTERQEAQELFILVDRAYKVLSDETERSVYDSLGLEGLEALHRLKTEHRKTGEDLQVGFVDERGRVLREKILGNVELERELEAIGRFNVRGATQVNVDASGLLGNAFDPPSEYDLIYGVDPSWDFVFDYPKVTGVVIQQSVDAAVSRNHSISLGAQVLTRGGRAVHSLTVGHEYKISDSMSSELTLTSSLRDPLGLSLKAHRTLDQYTKGTLEFVIRERGQTGLNIQAARKLTETVTGVLQVGFGVESGLVLQLNHSNRFRKERFRSKQEQEEEFYKTFYDNQAAEQEGGYSTDFGSGYEDDETEDSLARSFFNTASAALFVSGGGFGLQGTWARSLSEKSHGKVAVKLGTSNIELELTSSRVLSAHSKGNISLTMGLTGVRVTLRYDRGGMRYVLPLSLTSGFSLGASVMGGVIPMTLNYTFLHILQPYRQRRKATQRFQTALELWEERRKVRTQVELLTNSAAQRREQGEKSFGLVILRARYGTQLGTECDWRDVLQPELNDFLQEKSDKRSRIPSDWDIDEEDSADEGEDRDALEQDSLLDEGEEDLRARREAVRQAAKRSGNMYVDHPPNIDVTDQLNYFCNGDTLSLHGGKTKANLIGFYNPCKQFPGVEPQLYIRYKLASWVFELTCDDLEPVQLPSHRAILIGNLFTEQSAQFESR